MRTPGALWQATHSNRAILALTVVLLYATALRFYGLDAGIPYSLGADEPAVMDHVVRMMKTGNLHPPFFDYPGLAFYLYLPVTCLRFLKGASVGEWDSLATAGASEFYLWSRGMTAVLGVATVFLTYRIGCRWGVRHALLAAGLLAVMPLHVRESRLVLTDVPMTFFVTLSVLLSLRAHEHPTLLRFVGAGVVAGLATSVKYTAGLALLIPLLAAARSGCAWRSRVTWAGGAAAGFSGAFLFTAPYTVLDLPGFLNGFAGLARSYGPRGLGDDYGWRIYLKHLRLSLHWPAFILVFIGLGLAVGEVMKKTTRFRSILLVTFPIVFLLVIADRKLIFARYLLPIVPMVCVMVAIAIVWLMTMAERLDRRPAVRAMLGLAMIAIAIVPIWLHSFTYMRNVSVVSTQTLAYEWIRTNIPPGSRIVLERDTLRFPADLYPAVFVRHLTDQSLERYRTLGATYLVASMDPGADLPNATGAAHSGDAAHDRFLDGAQEVVRFSPSGDRPGPDLLILKLR